jgi:uncharacterized protein
MERGNDRRVGIFEYEGVELSRPYVIVGLPEVGLVGTIVANYLVQTLKLREIGYVHSDLEQPVVVVQEGEPKYPVRLFGKENIVVIISEVPFSTRLAYEFSGALAQWCMEKKSRLMIGTTGFPSRQRIEEVLPRVFGVSTERNTLTSLKNLGAEVFSEGLVVGTYAYLLRKCMTLGQPNLTLLAQSHLDFPDPGAAAQVINVLKSILAVEIDVKPLLDESEQIRLKMRELMKRAQKSMQQMTQQQAAPSVYA